MAIRLKSIKIKILGEKEEVPWDILFLADESKKAVSEYLERGTCYIAELEGKIVGQFVLMETRAKVFEIMNIAVLPKLRSHGLGTKLIRKAIQVAKAKGGRVLEVGTGNSSFRQLAFYQRAGFRIVGVDTDFFVGRYKKTYKTQGVKLIDMVRLSMKL